MFTFSHEGAPAGVAFLYLIGAIISAFIGWLIWEDSHYHTASRHPVRIGLITGIVLFVIGFSAVNGIAWGTSVVSTQDRSATLAEKAQHFGFVDGQEYPLELGSRITGGSGQGSVSGNLFYIRGSVNIQPASSISVSFVNGDSTYMLELPTSGITFKQKEGVKPSLQFYLEDPTDYNTYPDGTQYKETYGPCKFVIHDLLANCEKPTLKTDVTIDGNTERLGLSPIVAKHFSSATITLTPEMYKQLLNQH